MKISVIIPFDKGDDYLRDCLNSLAEMKFKNFEVVLVTDHYNGDITVITSEYKKRLDIKVFSTDEGKTGVAAARNTGLDHAQGEYVYFLDADDYLFEEALKVLLDSAEETGEDIIYGKKHYTYYKRDVFLPIYIEKREALIAQQLSEQNEIGGVEEETEEEELTEEEKEERELTHRNNARRKGIKRLVANKQRLRNVSVLNLLIRRSVIEDNGLRFDEGLKYYSDADFLVRLLDKDVKLRKRYHAHYIKRSHQDPVSHPALTQMMDEGRFPEMIKTFRKMMEEVNPEGYVRTAIDHQVVVYFCDYFAQKIKRSENDVWRTDRFETMKKLAEEILPENLKKEKLLYRKLIKALKKGNVAKCKSITTNRLGFHKFLSVFKKKHVIGKYLYRSRFLKKPVVQNRIMFETFFGKSYSDSPKYIYEYIAKTYPGKYELIWVLNEKTKLPYEGKRVKRFSLKYMYYLATTKYFVYNVRQPSFFKKRKGTVFFETWHGTPLKKLAFDLDEVFGASPNYKKQIYKQSRSWDYLLAANKFSSETFRRCYRFDGKMCECGYPRNDILHAENRDEIAAKVKKELNIPVDKKVLLYAPTWRDDECYGHGQYKFELKLELDKMKARLGDGYVVLLRTHYYIADAIDTSAYGDFTRNVCRYSDISELYLISDIIITDYSSVFFDYANLRRPMLFYTYDMDKYRDVLRGFYIDMEKELPGPLLYTTEEVIDSILNIDKVTEKYASKYDEFYERFCSWEDGHGAEKCAQKLLKK